MEERDVVAGACAMEKLAATHICYQNFSSHLSDQLVNHHFRAMFGVSSRTDLLLWVMLDVDIAGPVGGKHIHLLWMLLFLKEYCNQDSLSSRCHVTMKTFRRWVDIFSDYIL